MMSAAGRIVSRRALVTAAAAALAGLSDGRVARSAGAWPARPVKLVVPFAPGGAVDIVGRLVARYLSNEAGQQVYVENRSGAGGSLGTELVVKAPPDGHTLLLHTVSSAVINALTYADLRFDPRKDLTPITEIAAAPTLIVINAQVPAATLGQFVALVRHKPGQFKFGSTGAGSSVHLAGQLFATRERLEMVHVPYRGEGEAIKDLVAGVTQMETGVASAFLPFIRAGQLRALCVNGDKRIALLPQVPTAAEAGLADFDLPNWYALYAPRGLPDDITRRISESTGKVLALPDVRTRLAELGLEAIGSSPAEMAAYLDRQFAFWTPVVKASGVKLTR
ncbi:MAG TPA: tripartite tricarboxylate transporter substrate binding protein [Xanthobacteraceae bacterium]